jgi:hypothetical protein
MFSRPNHQQKHLHHEEETLSTNNHPMNHQLSATPPRHIRRGDMTMESALKLYIIIILKQNDWMKPLILNPTQFRRRLAS